MRAPAPSFKSELEACRQRLIGIGLRPDDHRLAIDVLDRWKDHASAETIWSKIRQKMPGITAREFIAVNLERRLAIAEQLKVRIPEMHGVEASARRRAAHHRKAGDGSRAAAEMSQLERFRADRVRVLGRKMKDAPRVMFMKGWSAKFRELCGQPLDEVVAFLTEVTFGGQVTIDAVRRARR